VQDEKRAQTCKNQGKNDIKNTKFCYVKYKIYKKLKKGIAKLCKMIYDK